MASLPGLGVGPALGRLEEVLEWDVNEREPGLGQQLAGLPELTADVNARPFSSSTQARTESGVLIGTGRR